MTEKEEELKILLDQGTITKDQYDEMLAAETQAPGTEQPDAPPPTPDLPPPVPKNSPPPIPDMVNDGPALPGRMQSAPEAAAASIDDLIKETQDLNQNRWAEQTIEIETVDGVSSDDRLKEARDLYQDKRYDEATPLLEALAYEGFTETYILLGNCEQSNEHYAAAADWYKKASELGNKAAQCSAQCCLGDLYRMGRGVDQDFAKAAEWYRRAGEQGNAIAQYYLGYFYDEGKGIKEDKAKAAEWYRKSAELGDPDSQFSLGVLFYNGKGVSKDRAMAVEWWLKAAGQGRQTAQCYLAECYRDGDGVSRDNNRALEWFRKSAAQGNERAKEALAKLEKEIADKDALEKKENAAIADAESGGASAKRRLGWIYYEGDGLPKDLAKAFQWFLKASEAGDADAMVTLGYMYDNGEGTSKNGSKAFEWYSKAAENGEVVGQYNLGCAYRDGQGVSRNYKKAREWFLKAAKQGYANAQNNLGCLYSNGQGGNSDPARAYKWFKKAAAKGNANAQQSLDRMKNPGDKHGVLSYIWQIIVAAVCGSVLGWLGGTWLLKWIPLAGPYMTMIGAAGGVCLGFFWKAPKKDSGRYENYQIKRTFNRILLLALLAFVAGPKVMEGPTRPGNSGASSGGLVERIASSVKSLFSGSGKDKSGELTDEVIAILIDRNGDVIKNGIAVSADTENGRGRIYRVAYADNWTVISVTRTNGAHDRIALAEPGEPNAYYVENAETGKKMPLRAIRHFDDQSSGAGADLIFDAIGTYNFNMIEGEDTDPSAWHFYNVSVPE